SVAIGIDEHGLPPPGNVEVIANRRQGAECFPAVTRVNRQTAPECQLCFPSRSDLSSHPEQDLPSAFSRVGKFRKVKRIGSGDREIHLRHQLGLKATEQWQAVNGSQPESKLVADNEILQLPLFPQSSTEISEKSKRPDRSFERHPRREEP